MLSVTELACSLSSELDSAAPCATAVAQTLGQLCEALDQSPGAGAELDEILFDLHGALIKAAGTSAAAEGRVRRLLSAAVQHCAAREVFTLCLATLSHKLSCTHAPRDDAEPATPGSSGTCSPSLQLFLLDTLQACLPRIKRRPLHFLASLLALQLRWSAEVLPSLALGGPTFGISTNGRLIREENRAVTVTSAVASLARWAASTAQWVQQASEQQQPQQLSAQEQGIARQLQGTALLQLASIVLQLPQSLAAAAAALPAPVQGGAPGPAAPAAGSRLPLMQATAERVVCLAQTLLQHLPTTYIDASCSNELELQLLIDAAAEQAAASGADLADLSYLCAREAAEGAAVAACAAAWAPGAAPQLQASSLQQALPQAATILLNLGAQHQSVALTLLPLGAVCQAARLAASSPACQLGASSAALDHLFAALVGIMSHNPVQLVRSCAHDAVQALLDAFQPGARLAQLEALMQMPSTAATVVALQRLRQEMAAAWSSSSSSSASSSGSSRAAADAAGQPWLQPAALQLALRHLENSTEHGWHDEHSVLLQADVQAAALSLLRWVLLREAAAPRGLLPPLAAQRLLQQGLAPLQACVLRMLPVPQAQPGGSAGVEHEEHELNKQRQWVDNLLAVQRLHEALDCVLPLIASPE